ncbi:MAG: hypothetical protein MMC23_000809 [Stictis urceolatum]|nr:hypothetical protein [Stictis urceolata]
MASQHIEQLSEEEIASYKETFSIFDKDGNGTISAEELGEIMRSLGQHPTDSELRDIVDEADIDGNGTIDFNEFLHLMARPLPSAIDPNEEIKKAFEVFDRDGSGQISKAELQDVMKSIGEKLTDAEIDEMMAQADEDGSGTIDYQEFMKLMER